MRHANVMEKDQVSFDILKYKKIGHEVGKLEFHLDKALKSLTIIKDTCSKIEEETGVLINFATD
jgi:hypothetical protein